MPTSGPQSFTRQMKVMGALLLTLSAITPAASVYVIVPEVIQQAGTGAFLSFAAAGAVGLAMAFVYAELASAHPIAGGEYALFGRTLGPFVGFTYMGMNVVTGSLAPAVLALGAGAYLSVIWPGAPALPVALAVVGFATALGILNIRTNAVVTGIFLAVELVVLIVLATLGFSHPVRGVAELALHPVALSAGRLAPSPLSAIGLATAVAIFAFNGFGAATSFSEEMVGAPRRVARTILLALIITVGFEFVPTAAVLIGAPDLKALIASPVPFSDFVAVRGGRALSIAVSLGVALAIVNAMVAVVLINARFFYSSARDRAWAGPANAALSHIHPRFGSPWVANLVAGALAAVGCLVPFHLLLVLTGASVVVMYVLLCAGVIAGRHTGSTAHGAYRMPFYPVAPLLGLTALAYVLYANWIDPQAGRPSLIATAVLIGLAILYYAAMRARRGPGWAVVGPAQESE